jgi:hypothetical protein
MAQNSLYNVAISPTIVTVRPASARGYPHMLRFSGPPSNPQPSLRAAAHHLIRLHDLRAVPSGVNEPQFPVFSRELRRGDTFPSHWRSRPRPPRCCRSSPPYGPGWIALCKGHVCKKKHGQAHQHRGGAAARSSRRHEQALLRQRIREIADSVSRYAAGFRPKVKARESLASRPPPRTQDVRQSAIATPLHAGPRKGA